MAAGSSDEHEAKYRVTQGAFEQILSTSVIGFRKQVGEAIPIVDNYYDTSRCHLYFADALYRLRFQKEIYVGTFKFDKGEGMDGSVHHAGEISSDALQPSEVVAFRRHALQVEPYTAMRQFLAKLGANDSLQPLIDVRNNRTPILYRGKDSVTEVALDKVRFTRKNQSIDEFFVEAELKEGDYSEFKRFTTCFGKLFGFKPCKQNKVQVGISGLMLRPRLK